MQPGIASAGVRPSPPFSCLTGNKTGRQPDFDDKIV